MIRVKNTYVTIDNLKSITFENGCSFSPNYLVITYFYDDEDVKIEVKNFDEFVEVADDFCTKVNFMKGA